MEEILVVGTNHRHAPIGWREQIAFARDELPSALHMLRSFLPEVAILSTCNRIEIYAAALDAGDAQARIIQFLSESIGVSETDLMPWLYVHTGEAAVRHLLTVATGLDSMLVGEAQILGQVGDALEMAQREQTLGAILSRLFQSAISTGKVARTETKIGRGALSLGYAAVELAREIFPAEPPHNVLVIGAGEMAESVARCLAVNRIGPILVANRTFERACALAEKFGGRALHYGSIPDALADVDIVIASSSAPHAVIHRDEVSRALETRRGRPLFLIDIAVPRDVDPRVAQLRDARLYNIDDLRGICDANLARRQSEADQVQAIVETETQKFMAWLSERVSTPTIRALYLRAEALRRQEVERAQRRLGDLSCEQRAEIDAFSRSLVRKILHEPVLHLKQPGNGWMRGDYLEIARSLFGLPKAHTDPQHDFNSTRLDTN
jgi:glutamyl-tRNA reductase